LCANQTNTSADLSLADAWSLPHEPIKRLGGVTLVVVRSRKSLKVFESTIRAGYIKAVEIDPVHAILSTTKLTKKVLVRSNQGYLLPPSFYSISQELIYHVDSLHASREDYGFFSDYLIKLGKNHYACASFLGYRLGTRWAHINRSIELLQKARFKRLPNY
jgi:hypothetical protein